MHEIEVMTLRPNNKTELRILHYMTTVINYHLWKTRNDCVHDQKPFSSEELIRKLIRSVGARRRLQQHPSVTDGRKVPRLGELFLSLVTLFDISFPIDNG